MVGQTLSHYQIIKKIGEGGMGIVYLALDTRLERTVALKVLRPEAISNPEWKRRFVKEAKAASALNHPNIITVHDIGSADGVDFLVMEYAEGKPLSRVICGKPITVDLALDYATQIAAALAAAHLAGIVHRDIKPANVLITNHGVAKVLDFGLAKQTAPAAIAMKPVNVADTFGETEMAQATLDETPAPAHFDDAASGPHTVEGAVLGTVAYMSPEQAEGKPVDARTDVFAFGALLYEMLTGQRAFQGDSKLSTLTAILRDSPAALRAARADVPAKLEHIVMRCLEKQPASRYQTAAEVLTDISACRTQMAQPPGGVRRLLARPLVVAAAAMLLVALIAGAIWFGVRSSRVRWARNVAIPEITRLVEKEDFFPARRLLMEAERHIPGDSQLAHLRSRFLFVTRINTQPPGAELVVKDYTRPDSPWEPLGTAPVEVLLPPVHMRVRATGAGLQPWEGVIQNFGNRQVQTIELRFPKASESPPAMVLVPGETYGYRGPAVELHDYWIDQHEVTNREFKKFVEAGGYQKREYWTHPFQDGGRPLSWDAAMAQFRDSTGRPGPANWELGSYPAGQDDFPVGGVSWYEAAAYANFVGKSLPTIHHWAKAAGLPYFAAGVLKLSNFQGNGVAPVGKHDGLGPYGTRDMAGNVREWCWNETGHQRFTLGGAWSDPGYLFHDRFALSPFDRSSINGFRCVRYSQPATAAALAPLERPGRDYSKEKPVDDRTFEIYRGLYSYDRGDLRPAVETVEDTPQWRREKVTFDAAYGNERVIAHLFLPKNASPPYQVVVHFPGAYAVAERSSQELPMRWLDFVMRSGRALVHPVYKGTYERRFDPPRSGPAFLRERSIYWVKDMNRTVDYLETRADIDKSRIAYYGLSMGSAYSPILTAMEPRFKAAVLLVGGLYLSQMPAEADGINFAPRARLPILMLNGRDDFIFPLETSQKPMFRHFGAPDKDKRHFLFDGGHNVAKMQDVIRESLDWLDRYLGPVKTSSN